MLLVTITEVKAESVFNSSVKVLGRYITTNVDGVKGRIRNEYGAYNIYLDSPNDLILKKNESVITVNFNKIEEI